MPPTSPPQTRSLLTQPLGFCRLDLFWELAQFDGCKLGFTRSGAKGLFVTSQYRQVAPTVTTSRVNPAKGALEDSLTC
jgi:hypothetical protein